MISETYTFDVPTRGKGTYEITSQVRRFVQESQVTSGTTTVFVAHTSASLVIYENADPTAREDLHRFFEELVLEDEDYMHDAEGPDDSTSHIRSALTRTSEVIPVFRGHLALGTWQGIFVFEHRRAPHRRMVYVNVIGV